LASRRLNELSKLTQSFVGVIPQPTFYLIAIVPPKDQSLPRRKSNECAGIRQNSAARQTEATAPQTVAKETLRHHRFCDLASVYLRLRGDGRIIQRDFWVP